MWLRATVFSHGSAWRLSSHPLRSRVRAPDGCGSVDHEAPAQRPAGACEVVSPVWLLKSIILAIHAAQLAEHGGLSGILDATRLDAALDRPQNGFDRIKTRAFPGNQDPLQSSAPCW